MLTVADAELDVRTAFLEDDVRNPMRMKDHAFVEQQQRYSSKRSVNDSQRLRHGEKPPAVPMNSTRSHRLNHPVKKSSSGMINRPVP
jgi:hypothetical protein